MWRSRRHVGTMATRAGSPAGHREGLLAGGDGDRRPGCGRLEADADPLEERRLLDVGERRAEEPVDPARPERDAPGPGLVRCGVDPSGRGRPARPADDQLRDAVGAEAGEARLLALLEAEARLGAEREVEGRAADAHRVEDGQFDDDVGRRLRDLRGRPAHDAGDGERTAGIGDEERLRRELPLDVVERLEGLARRREPHPERGAPARVAADGCRVEGMGRLAELEHHVVRRVDHVADRAHAGRQEPHLDVVGRRPDAHAGDPAADEARAERGILDGRPRGAPPSRARCPRRAARRGSGPGHP